MSVPISMCCKCCICSLGNYDPGEKADDDFIDDDDYESGKSESDASMESSEEEKVS